MSFKSSFKPKKRPSPSREIVCITCGKVRLTRFVRRGVCQGCHNQELSEICSRCKGRRHLVDGDPPICPSCARIFARRVLNCRRCGTEKIIFNEERMLCARCHVNEQRRVNSQSKQVKAICLKCGELKSSALVDRKICTACYTKERNGKQICAGCNEPKIILIKSKRLCKRCYNNRCAPGILKAYIADYSSPFTYNRFIFDLFTESIKWSAVDEKVASRIKTFGRFLQIQQLPSPLSWEAIIKLLPPLQATNRTTPKQVRMCLLELGHLLVAKGELESWEAYSRRRYALHPIEYAPKNMREIMRKYAEWLWEKQRTSKTVRLHLDALARFGKWCICSGLKLTDDIQPFVVEKYLDSIKWHCSVCLREKL
jgi:hypothetical protein